MIDLHISCIAYGSINGNSIMIRSVGCIGQQISIDLDNGLVLNKWQAITWANEGIIHFRVYVSLRRSLDELNAADAHHGAAKIAAKIICIHGLVHGITL